MLLKAMVPLQIPGGPELLLALVIGLGFNLVVLIGVLGGLGYFLLRIRSGGVSATVWTESSGKSAGWKRRSNSFRTTNRSKWRYGVYSQISAPG